MTSSLFTPIDLAGVGFELTLATDIRHAITENEVELLFQPQVAVATGRHRVNPASAARPAWGVRPGQRTSWCW